MKLLLMPFLVILAVLTACSGPTPAPDPKETPTPRSSSATPALPANTLVPEGDGTAPTEPPTARPTAAPTETPASDPTPGPTLSPASPRVLAPLAIQDPQALLYGLSDSELDCIEGDTERLARSLPGPNTAPREELGGFIDCLDDETLARVFLAGFVPGTEPLSPETSTSVRAAFDVIDPRAVMTAGIEGDPGAAMAGSMAALTVTIACLSEEEWAAAVQEMGMMPQQREELRCLMEALGGPKEMAEAMGAALEGDLTTLVGPGEERGLETGPPLGQVPVTLPETPTATVEATMPAGDAITPFSLNDGETILTHLSKSELTCLEQAVGPGNLPDVLDHASVPVPEGDSWIIDCLEDDTLLSLFLNLSLGETGPLSGETSACLRTGLGRLDLRGVMAEDEQDIGWEDRSEAVFISGALTALTCLSLDEWDANAPDMSLEPGDQEAIRCFLEKTGGSEALLAALEGAGQGGGKDLYQANDLYQAAVDCGLSFLDDLFEPTPPEEAPVPPTTLVITVAEIPADIPEYDRGEWRHWVDRDGDCQDAREEVLIAESLEQVTYETDRQCRVEWGRWWAPHLHHHLENPRHIDVDHHVPLRNAHLSGGWRWDAERKEE